ncbi:pilus assembly protein [Marinobacter halodurans]|uniref:Pilus assembly protein n=1 Tax=Marinobacter halodurans TaxID=2528979 RepID=A0ABY1ZK69_9GAMM|nr:TadE family protein [Marinobacter halodurans]TBW54340.1 pilus assembly protein [Marinobacter halodurans]
MSIHPRNQAGAHTVEFAIVGAMFFVLLFAAIEFGRLMFVWNTLDEVSRKSARVAAVCPVNHSAIRRVGMFDAPGSSGPSPILPALNESDIRIDYLDASGTPVDPATQYMDIAYVRSEVSGVRHRLIIPFFVQEFELPSFITVLPRESLGVSPEGTACFGTTI